MHETVRQNYTYLTLKVVAWKNVPEILFKCDPPQDFNAKGESTRTTRFHFKTNEFILTRFSTLAILPH